MRRNPFGRGRALVAGCGWLILLPFVIGCGGGKGTVSGRVLYNKQPVTGGTVTFAPVKGGSSPVTATIDENGNYQITVPVGEMYISVDNEALKPVGAGEKPSLPPQLFGKKLKLPPPEKGKRQQTAPAGERPPGKYVAIPAKYARLDNGLKYTVTSGSQPHDIELK